MTESPLARWTVEALKAHLEALIAASEQRQADLLQAERHLRLARREDDLRAIDKAESAMTRRLDSMNELRQQLNTQDKTFVTIPAFRAELDKVTTLVERNREDLEKFHDQALPRESFETILNEWMVWRKSLDTFLQGRIGAEKGLSGLGALLVKLVAVAVGLIAIITVLADHFTK